MVAAAATAMATIQSGLGCITCFHGVRASKLSRRIKGEGAVVTGASSPLAGASYIGLARSSHVSTHGRRDRQQSLQPSPVKGMSANGSEGGFQGGIQVFADADYRKGGTFATGFLLGGVLFGVLGFVFAPQLSKSLLGENADGTPRRLPRWMEDDSLEATRESLNDKIAELNAAIDDVSAQLRADDSMPINQREELFETAT